MECMRTVGSLLLALFGAGNTLAQQRPSDALRYFVYLTIPDTGTVISGRTGILVRPSGEDTIRLNLVGMQIDSVSRVDGDDHSTPISFHYDGRIISVPTDGEPTAGLMIRYHGSPQDGLIIGPSARRRRVAFADNWPERARFWIPTLDHPSDKARVMFNITAPPSWRVVANRRADYAGTR